MTPTDGKETEDIPALYLRILLSTLFSSMEVPFEKEAHPGLQEMLANSVRAFIPLRLAAGESPSQASPFLAGACCGAK